MDKKETVLEAFCRQNGIVPGSFEQSEEHAKLYGEENKVGEIEKLEDAKARAEAAKNMFNPKPLSELIDIPSQIKSSDLNQKTEVSPQFKDYDHNLEDERWRKIGGKDSEADDGLIQMEEI